MCAVVVLCLCRKCQCVMIKVAGLQIKPSTHANYETGPLCRRLRQCDSRGTRPNFTFFTLNLWLNAFMSHYFTEQSSSWNFGFASPTATKWRFLISNFRRVLNLVCILLGITLHPALEDGTDRGFRNVGKPQSDAGEIPKRIHTKKWRLLTGSTISLTL